MPYFLSWYTMVYGIIKSINFATGDIPYDGAFKAVTMRISQPWMNSVAPLSLRACLHDFLGCYYALKYEQACRPLRTDT